jgi:hypothetical protein
MNLLVGVLCEDGVVVGSADLGRRVPGGLSPDEPSSTDTRVVGHDLIFGGSGRVGLGQRFAHVLSLVRSDSRFTRWNGWTIAKAICAEAVDDLQSTRGDMGQFGALVAFPSSDGFHLCRFAAADLQPELTTPEQWFASMGAGRPVADRFLAFLRKVFFPQPPPGLRDGVFLATWALDHAVGLGSGQIAADRPATVPAHEPADLRFKLAVLAPEAPDTPLTARLLSAEELSNSLAEVRAAERHLAAYRQRPFGGRPHGPDYR